MIRKHLLQLDNTIPLSGTHSLEVSLRSLGLNLEGRTWKDWITAVAISSPLTSVISKLTEADTHISDSFIDACEVSCKKLSKMRVELEARGKGVARHS